MQLERKLTRARLYVIVDLELTTHPFGLLASNIAEAGADLIQVRGNSTADRRLVEIAGNIVESVRRTSRTLVLVNNRVDIALASDADGVHLGSDDLTIDAARRLGCRGQVVGATTHSAFEAESAARAGADYLSYGPVYRTAAKPGLAPRGFSYLEAIRRLGPPFFAIGGVTAAKIPALKRRGIDRVCVCSAVLKAKDPAAATRAIREALDA